MMVKKYRKKDKNYNFNDGSDFISGLKKVNIFVGSNNSGKSRFMRQIFKASKDDFVFFDDVYKDLESMHQKLEPRFGNLFYMAELKELALNHFGDYISRVNNFINTIQNKKERSTGTGDVWDIDVANAIRDAILISGIIDKLRGKHIGDVRHIYIPILRGLRHIDPVSQDDLYVKKTMLDYRLNEGLVGDHDIFSGLTIYSESKRMLLGSKKDRKFIRDFESFISKNFFSGRSVTIIPDHNTDNVKLNINDGEDDREIFNLGDGIQSILIATFKIFQHQHEYVALFIEEPEMMMHPSMQRVLIETFINKFPNLQVFLTTHSNHFLDLTYDYPDEVAIFSFEESSRENFKVENITDNRKILDLLGIRNSSVFLANCVIWTEGVTDRMLLRKIIEIDNTFKYAEDFHYAFAEYGGGNLENFDFVDTDVRDSVNVLAISGKNYIIIDSDLVISGKKFERRQRLKAVIGENNVFDRHVEIENLIPYKIWKILIDNLLKDSPTKAIKLKNQTKNSEINFNKQLGSKKIGYLLKKFLIEKKPNVDVLYFDNDNVSCLGETKKFISEYIIKIVDEYEFDFSDFPDVTQDLITSIKDFITLSNNK